MAFHESGHALVASSVPKGVPVTRSRSYPTVSGSIGFTLQLPVEEKFLTTESEFRDQIAILLGGRVAEEIAYGDISSGAQNDLERASEIARAMVTQLGMSETLGPLTWGRRESLQFLGVHEHEERNFSEATAQLIDQEVRRLIDEGHARANQILAAMRPSLEALAELLCSKEVVSGEEVKQVISAHQCAGSGG
ncbi:MAG: hypothetical protein R3E50_16625 [Halioglobus sp.]